MIVMSHCEPTLSRFSILMLNNVVERTSRCFWISHHVPESAVAVLAAKKSAPLELRNDFLRERIEVYGHDRETDHETVTSTVPVPVLHLVSDIRSRPREDRQAEAGNQSLIGLADSYCVCAHIFVHQFTQLPGTDNVSPDQGHWLIADRKSVG